MTAVPRRRWPPPASGSAGRAPGRPPRAAAFCSRSARTAARSPARSSKSPTSRAKASSSGGSSWRFTSCSATRSLRILPRRASSGWSSGRRISVSATSPGWSSMIRSSRAGNAWPSPRMIECGCGSVGPSSSSEVTSTCTIWPALGRCPSTGSQVAFCSRSRPICSSTSTSVTAGTLRDSLNPPTVDTATSGRTSTCSSNSIAPPSSNLRLRIDGSATGFSASDSRAWFQLSRMTSSSTVCRMASWYFLRTMAGGAWPFRNPGIRTLAATCLTARSSAMRTRSTGTVTWSDLEAASPLVGWIVMVVMARGNLPARRDPGKRRGAVSSRGGAGGPGPRRRPETLPGHGRRRRRACSPNARIGRGRSWSVRPARRPSPPRPRR